MHRVDRMPIFREQLERERASLLEQIQQIGVAEYESLGYGNHMADDATEAFEQAKDLALRQNLERLLEEVEDALERFEEGTYGICEDCGQEIDTARLKAIPYARLCLECQRKRERR